MPSESTTWLVIEPTVTGHHYTYLERIIAGNLARGIRVIVGVGTDTAGEQIEQRLRVMHPTAELGFVRTPLPRGRAGFPGLVGGMVRWRRFWGDTWRAANRSRQIDLVFVPYLDYALFALALLGSPFGQCPYAGITMRQRFHFSEMGIVSAPQRGAAARRVLFERLLAQPTLRRLLVIDETLPEYVARRCPAYASKVAYMPDPSDPPRRADRHAARSALGLPADAHLVLLYGYIEPRKGVATLLEWAARAGATGPHVVLAGTVDAAARVHLTGAAAARLGREGRVHVLDRYVTAVEEQLLFSAADWVWLAYESFELMSGVMVKAAQHGLGVLIRDVGLIGHFARRYALAVDGPGGACAARGLPPGVQLRSFGEGSPAFDRLPDHSWESASRIVHDASHA